jgi:hypothetical protein
LIRNTESLLVCRAASDDHHLQYHLPLSSNRDPGRIARWLRQCDFLVLMRLREKRGLDEDQVNLIGSEVVVKWKQFYNLTQAALAFVSREGNLTGIYYARTCH